MYSSPRIHLTTEEDSGKPHLRDYLMTVRAVIASNGVFYFQMTSVDRTVRQGGRRKERKDGVGTIIDKQMCNLTL